MGGVGTHAESVISELGRENAKKLVLMVDYKLDNTSGKHMLGGNMLASQRSDLKEVRKEQNRRSSRRVKVW